VVWFWLVESDPILSAGQRAGLSSCAGTVFRRYWRGVGLGDIYRGHIFVVLATNQTKMLWCAVVVV